MYYGYPTCRYIDYLFVYVFYKPYVGDNPNQVYNVVFSNLGGLVGIATGIWLWRLGYGGVLIGGNPP